MAKNNLAPIIKKMAEDITLKVYAGMCVALSEYCENLTPDDIMKICELSEAVWNETTNRNIDIYKWCYDVSGVDLKKFLSKC